jgi:glc operon protein GlcG
MKRLQLLALALAAVSAPAVSAEIVQGGSLTLAGARMAIETAKSAAVAAGAGGAIAVVDAGGHLIALERIDGTFPMAGQISTGKARTAAGFQRPTSVFEDLVNGGRTTMVALEDFTPLRGGVPIVVDDAVVGAVGVAGAKSAQHDEELAVAAATAVQEAAGANP